VVVAAAAVQGIPLQVVMLVVQAIHHQQPQVKEMPVAVVFIVRATTLVVAGEVVLVLLVRLCRDTLVRHLIRSEQVMVV
jgi:hypothetical protein